MNVKKITPKKNKAQAMVEFAIVLPILLLLLYGILETGRLLFIYSSIVTASRQAVRYGSATGEGGGGALKRYQDCAGIRLAAQRVDYLNAFNDDDIIIQHDTGPGSTPVTFCPNNSPDTSFDPGSSNNHRLLVVIDGDYLPIVPKIVPFLERSDSQGDPITAESARTILVSVSIIVTVPPSTWVPSSPTATPTPPYTATPTPTDTATPTASFTPIYSLTPSLTPTITSSPTVTLTPSITPTRTPSFTPSPSPTAVTNCNTVTTGNITLSGNTMIMTINNPNGYPITAADIFVVWNHDKGHGQGNDKDLVLLSASLQGSPPFWTGNSTGPSDSLDPASPLIIPASGTSTIVFTFDQSYDHFDGSEEILINLSTPGCENYPIHEKK